MKERNISTVAILTNKYNHLSANSPYSMDRKTLEYYLRENGFLGDFERLIPIMLKEQVLHRYEGKYFFPIGTINLELMRRVMKLYRERNHAKYMRKIEKQCNAAKKFLEKHGYFVVEDDFLSNTNTTNWED